MAITVNIPTILRPFTGNQKRLQASGGNVLDIIEQIEQQYTGIKAKLLSNGEVYGFINIYVNDNDNDIRFSEGLATPLCDGDSLTILPSVAGG